MPLPSLTARVRLLPLPLALTLLVPLILLSAASPNPSLPVGAVFDETSSITGPELTSSGMTVYDGDHLQTEGTRTMRVRLHRSQLYLYPGTFTEVHGTETSCSVTLLSGEIAFLSGEGRNFQLAADGAIIRPSSNTATVAEVTWVSSRELLFSVSRGRVEVATNGTVKTMDAGNSYRMSIEPDDGIPQDNGDHGNSKPAGRSKIIKIVVPVTAGAVAIVLWRALVSPSAP